MDPRTASLQRALRTWRVALTAVPVCAALVPISIVGACQWRAVREAEAVAALKRDLIDRGLTVPDVERLAHGPQDRWRDGDSYYRTQHLALEDQLKRELAQRNVSAEQIAGVLRAATALQPASGRYTYESHAEARQQADLIRQLLQQGRTPAEVERVLRAGSGVAADARRAEAEAAVRVLRNSGMSAEEVSRALRPAEAPPAAAAMPPVP